MRRILILMVGVAALLCVLAGCSGCTSTPAVVKNSVIKIDELAAQNEAVVEKLVLDRASVTEDEEVIAIRNARAIAILTSALRKGVE